MPRVRVRKTQRGRISITAYEQAFLDFKAGSSLRVAAAKYGLCHVTLNRYVKKKNYADSSGNISPISMGYRCVRRVFNDEDEEAMVQHILNSPKISTKEIRKLAFDLACQKSLQKPAGWDKMQLAGTEWLSGFMKRHPQLLYSKAEPLHVAAANACSKILNPELIVLPKNRRPNSMPDLMPRSMKDKIDVPGPSSSKRLKSNDDLENDSNDIDDSRLKVNPIKNAQKPLHSPHASKGFKDSSEFGADFLLAGGQPSENEASQKVSSDEIYIKEEDFTSSNESFLLSETPNPGIEEIDSLKMEVMDEEISDESFSLKPTSSGTSEQWSKSDEMNFAEAGLVMGTNYSSNEAPVPSVPHAPPVRVSTTFIRGGRIAQNNNPVSSPPVSSSTCNLLPKQNLPKTNLPKNSLPIEELNEPGDYGAFVNSMVTEMDLKQQVLAKFYIFKILDLGKNGKLTPMGVTL